MHPNARHSDGRRGGGPAPHRASHRAPHVPSRRAQRLLHGLLLAAGLAGVTACDRRPDPLLGNDIVILNIETLRADFTGFTAGESRYTPCIDSLATGGIVAANSYAVAPWTRPSVGSLLTSLYPARHGADEQDPYDALSADANTIAEILQENGYETFAWMTNSNLAEPLGFSQGFEHFAYIPSMSAKTLNRRLLAEWDAWKASASPDAPPSFLYVHYVEPHNAYFQTAFHGRERVRDLASARRLSTTVSPVERVAAAELYGSHVLEVDRAVGAVVDSLRARMPECVIVITADHGEEWFDHGGLFHGFTLHEELVRVPLVLLVPNAEPARLEETIENIDVLPTLLDIVGIDPPSGIDGRSFAKAIYWSWPFRFPSKRSMFTETRYDRHLTAVRKDGRAVVLDMETEEIETVNLADDRQVERYLRELAEHLADAHGDAAPAIAREESAGIEELTKELRALGYLGGRDASDDTGADTSAGARDTTGARDITGTGGTSARAYEPASEWRALRERYHYIAATDTSVFTYAGYDAVPESTFPRRVVLDAGSSEDASVRFPLRASKVDVVFFSTPWSGIVEIAVDGDTPRRYDLWTEPGTLRQRIVPVEGTPGAEVIVRATGDRNERASRPLVYLSGLIVEAENHTEVQ